MVPNGDPKKLMMMMTMRGMAMASVNEKKAYQEEESLQIDIIVGARKEYKQRIHSRLLCLVEMEAQRRARKRVDDKKEGVQLMASTSRYHFTYLIMLVDRLSLSF